MDMTILVAHEGETLDALLWRALERTDITPQVLAANPHLATLPPLLPAGTRVTVPPISTPTHTEIIRLWGEA